MIERKLRSVVNWQVAVKQGLMYTHAGIHSFFQKSASHMCITKLNFDLLSQYFGAETHRYVSLRLLCAVCELIHILVREERATVHLYTNSNGSCRAQRVYLFVENLIYVWAFHLSRGLPTLSWQRSTSVIVGGLRL
jgi:hypothetical protein